VRVVVGETAALGRLRNDFAGTLGAKVRLLGSRSDIAQVPTHVRF